MGLLTDRKINQGFLHYGSNDDSVVEFATLKDASNLGSMVISGTANFNADGLQCAIAQNDGGTIYYPSSFSSQFKTGGHVSFDMTSSFFNTATSESTASVLFNVRGGNEFYLLKTTGTNWQAYRGATLAESLRLRDDGMDDMVKVHISWNNNKVDFYVDYILCQSFTYATAGPSFSSTINLLNLNGGNQITKARIANIQWATKSINLPVTQNMEIAVVGDSFTQLGNYPRNFFKFLGHQTDDYSDGNLISVNDNDNRGMVPVIHSELAKRGIYINGRVKWYGRGGCSLLANAINKLSTRITALLTESVEYPAPSTRGVFNKLVISIGINDIGGSDSINALIAEYKTQLDRVKGIAGKIYILNVTDRYPPAIVSDASAIEKIAAFNVEIKLLENYASNITVLDANSLISSFDIRSDGVHPLPIGQYKLGKLIAGAIY